MTCELVSAQRTVMLAGENTGSSGPHCAGEDTGGEIRKQ